jgi:two-component system, OmpR family, response regulator
MMSKGCIVRVLVVEDDPNLSDVLRRGLSEAGYAVDVCDDGERAVFQAETVDYDGIVLDIMLPGKDGLTVCRELRAAGATTPILMLTARDTVDDTVMGLEAGADDYLRKPFAFRELRARLQAIIRRPSGSTSLELRAGTLVLDVARREARLGDRRFSLTNREYQILEYLVRNPGRTMTRMMIEDHVWGHGYPGLSNTVDVHIRRLRAKIDPPGAPSIVETVRGAGYRLRSEGS